MRVKRNFEDLYRTEPDPWEIGQADSPRYEVYRRLILSSATRRGRILDIGCGLGAFLARFQVEFAELIGFELSHEAVARGAHLHPGIQFVQGSATELSASPIDGTTFDTIVCSDVIAYLKDAEKDSLLAWIARHLTPGGVALVAAWSPGGKYLTPDELGRLVRRHFSVSATDVLDSGHALFLGAPRRRLVAVTVDYETWHPMPEEPTVDWNQTVFDPTEKLFAVAEKSGAVLTFMAEMGEYLWLLEHDPAVAVRMAAQWREAIDRGHDVQLHLHPNWLPEVHPRRTPSGLQFDWSVTRLADYPGDLSGAIRRAKTALRDAVSPVAPDHAVTCFRAGAYAAQPFPRLFDALVENGIECDSSVYRGGVAAERGYDYRLAYSAHQPYFASRNDPQLLAPPAEARVVELPIFTPRADQRWLFDGEGSTRLVDQYTDFLRRRNGPPTEINRIIERAGWLARGVYAHSAPLRPLINRAVPDAVAELIAPYAPPDVVTDDYFVMIGHTKGAPRWEALTEALVELGGKGCQFAGLSTMAQDARGQLSAAMRNPQAEPAFQVERERDSILSADRNVAQSRALQRRIPLDRSLILDLGCGAGYWTTDIARDRPWSTVVGLDFGEEFLQSGRSRHNDAVAGFLRGDFGNLPFADGGFDCVYADNVLEHAFDPSAVLREIRRVLSPSGVLVAAVPSDGRNPGANCDNHIWKTVPADVRTRLVDAGFEVVRLDEINIRRRMASSPFPPSLDRMVYVTAWRQGHVRLIDRVRDAVAWTYERLDPSEVHTSVDPRTLLTTAHAWCEGYAIVLQHVLAHEGVATRRVDFSIRWHPRAWAAGVGAVDQHSILEAHVDGRWHALDPTCGVVYEGLSVADLVAAPNLADGALAERPPDDRFVERDYAQYCSAFAYERAFDVHYHVHRPRRAALQLAQRLRPRAGHRLLESKITRA